jgi:hypothetical protein
LKAVLLNELGSYVTRYGLITAFHKCGQASKGVWWMPWRAEAMKDVVGCDKLRGVAKHTLIRRCPNGATRHPKRMSLPAECIGRVERTQRTDTSQYLEERKSTETPLVAASESGPAHEPSRAELNALERATTEGDSPVNGRKRWLLSRSELVEL